MAKSVPRINVPANGDAKLAVDKRDVRLTNLDKLFWPERGITKGLLIQYYADVAPVLLPHIQDRAMVMKRYPHGAASEPFFMKRAPVPRPEWIRTCSIAHGSGNVIDFPVIDDLPSLLWVINLGCIDLNQWYARCDDINRPDYVHFDLDPGPGATFDHVRESALLVREALEGLQTKPLVKSYGYAGAPRWANALAVAIQVVLVLGTLYAATRVRGDLRAGVAVAAMAPVVFFLTNKIFSPQFLILLLACWAVAIALLARNRAEQALLGGLGLVATFANAFVGEFVLFDHDRTWLTCSVVLFCCALVLTGWTLRRSVRA